jgi:hypothetical protein
VAAPLRGILSSLPHRVTVGFDRRLATRYSGRSRKLVRNTYPRNPGRINSRNGYCERLWEKRAGAVDLKIPKLRKGSYFPGLIERDGPGKKPLQR